MEEIELRNPRRRKFAKVMENFSEARRLSKQQLVELAKSNPQAHAEIMKMRAKMKGITHNIIASGASAAGNVLAGVLPGKMAEKDNQNTDQWYQQQSYGSKTGTSGGYGGAVTNDAAISRSEGGRG